MPATVRFRQQMLAVITAVSLFGTVVPVQAQQASLTGAWNGTGVMTTPSGNSEKVRCRATFSQNGANAYMTASCANASTRVNQTAELTRVAANNYRGDFLNREFGISGSIRITVNGNNLNASLSGGGGSASISLSR